MTHSRKPPICNTDVRQAAAGAGVCLWEIAQAIGLSDYTFSRKLRTELDADTKARAFAAINQLAAQQEGGAAHA